MERTSYSKPIYLKIVGFISAALAYRTIYTNRTASREWSGIKRKINRGFEPPEKHLWKSHAENETRIEAVVFVCGFSVRRRLFSPLIFLHKVEHSTRKLFTARLTFPATAFSATDFSMPE